MGLNDTYIGVRSNILLTSPLPSLGQAYSMVIQDEKQREIHVSPVYPGESASFIAAQHGAVGKGNNVRDFKGKKSGYEGKKNNSTCSYCKKPGHVVEQCYRLVGFPSDFKFTSQRKYQGSVQGNNAFSTEENAVQTAGIKSLTQENISQILQLLQQAPSMKRPLVIGRESCGLYVLESRHLELISKKSSSSRSSFVLGKYLCNQKVPSALFSFSSNSDVKNKLWHYRLGHMPLSNMKNISSIPNSSCDNFSMPCVICHMARQSKLPFFTSSDTSKAMFDLIHIDIWGPYNTTTYDGYKYFLTIVDDYSRGTWTYLLSTKSNVFPVLQSFLAMIESQFHNKVKFIHSDNAFELRTGNAHADFFSKQGILNQTTCSLQREKLDPKAFPYIFLGYPHGKKGYKVLNLDTKKIFVFRDVIFHEDIYPFASMNTSKHHKSTFPTSNTPEVNLEVPNLQTTNSVEHFDHPSNPPNQDITEFPTPLFSPQSTDGKPRNSPVGLRKSIRIHKTPSYLSDYITNAVQLTDVSTPCFLSPITIASYSVSALSTSNKSFLNSLSNVQEPPIESLLYI
ncbi:uncharacterized protein LOC142169799 [Nicotiana tabacum]|uniref:Uncharacterized protein LOC142169799 n=1 Tax=Nicotiana tabacum TaxID=4097 RepID=A0AC58SS64_TOBAC